MAEPIVHAWWHANYIRTDTIFPTVLQIEPSNMCNSACAFCPSKDITRPRGIMSFDLCRKVIDEAIAHPEFSGIIWYGLADPFTDEGIFEKIEYAREKKVRNMHVSTNGGLLDEEKERELRRKAVSVVDDATEFAENAPYPRPEAALEPIFAS